MIVNSVRLRNFRSHADTSIGFGTGINVILGDNGAGKTSVLEAISFALFKEYGGNLDNLVMRGKGEMSVELVFTSHGRKYKVVRTRKKASSDSNLFLLGKKESLIQSGDSEVDKEIARILGIDKYLFINAVYVRQGEIAKLLIARPAEKKQLISRLLGIDGLEKVWERMRAVVDAFRDRKNRLEAMIIDEDRTRHQLDEVMVELAGVKKRLGTTSRKITEISRSLRKAEAEERGLEEIEKRHAKLSSAMVSAQEALQREKDRLQSVMKESASIREAEGKIAETNKKLFPGWRGMLGKELDSKRKELSGLNERIGTLRGKISEMKDLESNLELAGDECPLCGSPLTPEHRAGLMEEKKARIALAEKEIAKSMHALAVIGKDIEKSERKRDGLAELEREASELKGIAKGRDEADAALKDGELAVKELGGKIAMLGRQLGDIREKRLGYEKVKGMVRDLRSELSALREASGRQHGKRQELENSRARLREEMRDIGKKKREHGRLARFLEVLGEIRGLFDKSGLQRELRIKSGPIIEGHMREFFSKFNFDYSDISLDEDYGVILFGPGGESTTDMISGGEKIAAALAMRLGIARTLVGGSAESMLLDEPTIFLDNQRRQDLIEVLKKLSVMPQLIVVTHDPAMEEAADMISVLRKERGTSMLEAA